jgi:hypothetical protein
MAEWIYSIGDIGEAGQSVEEIRVMLVSRMVRLRRSAPSSLDRCVTASVRAAGPSGQAGQWAA